MPAPDSASETRCLKGLPIDKAKVVQSPAEIYLPYGRSAVIDCHFRSNPPLLKLRWEKDGFLFDPYNVQGVFYRSNGSLFFDEVKEEHSGSYTCTPFNELGSEGPSPKMNVFVLKPPVFTVTPQILYIRRIGETLQVSCEAIEEQEIYKPNIAWLKDGKLLSKTGNLTLSNLQEEDRGIYRCTASNAVTSIHAETELMIENTAPRAPYDVRVEPGENSISVEWKSGLTKPKLEFSVWYRMADSTTWKFSPLRGEETREMTISGLLPGTEYEIMVLSKDIYGEGMFSKSVKVKTKGEIGYLEFQYEHQGIFKNDARVGGIGSPKNVNVDLTSEGWMITWEPPEEGVQELEHYEIRWTENESRVSAITKEPFFLVKDSVEERSNRFQVIAVTKNQIQSETSILVIRIWSEEKLKALTMGISLGFFILVTIFLLIWFARKRFGRKT